jgi:hypothetical protein
MGNVAQQRVLQLLGTVDYLIYLLQSAQCNKNP